VTLEVGILVNSHDQIRDKSVLSQKVIWDIINEWGGIQIKFRGFRVGSYGDDDWLSIDYDRGLRKGTPKNELLAFAESLQGVDASRSLLNMLSSRNYVGDVIIGNKASGFEMKANREGFLASHSMDQLRKFVRFAIDWSTILRDYYLRQESQKIALVAKEEFENVIDKKIESNRVVESALEYIDKEIRTVARNLPSVKRREVENSLSKATEAIRKHNDSNKTELSHLRLIASTSTLLLIFSHEVKSLLALLEHSKNSLKGISKSLSGENKTKVQEVADSFQDLNNRLEELLQMTSLVGTDKSRAKPGRIALKPKIEKVEKVFALITNKYHISIDYSGVPDNLLVKRFLEAEVYSILLNVLSNSIKAVIAGGDRKEIQVVAKRLEDNKTKITVRDSGVGLSSDRYNEVFTPFVSDPEGKLYINLEDRLNPEDNMIVGTGSGIGLGIVREIIKAHDGKICFKDPLKGWSTELEIELE
jgi:signal transduction histidine kinase